MTTTPELRFEFTYTYEDLRGATIFLTRKALIPTRKSLVGWIMIIALAVLFFTLYHEPAATPPLPATAPAAPPTNLLVPIFLNLLPYAVIIFFVWLLFFRKKAAARRWNKHDKKRLHTLTFLPTGLLWETPDSRSENTWRYYERFSESPTVFVLYISEKQAHPIPKRILTPEQILQVRAILNANIGKPKGFEVLPPNQNP